jgi:hypothetical protein
MNAHSCQACAAGLPCVLHDSLFAELREEPWELTPEGTVEKAWEYARHSVNNARVVIDARRAGPVKR